MIELKYGTLKGTSLQGLVGISVYIPKEFDDDYVDMLYHIYKIQHNGIKIVQFTGDFDEENQDEMFSAIKSLRDNGYIVHAIVQENKYYQWFMLVNWLVVEIEDTNWPCFKANEIQYIIDEPKEPQLPKDVSNVKLVCVQRKIKDMDLLSFIQKSPNNWMIYMHGKEISILFGEQT